MRTTRFYRSLFSVGALSAALTYSAAAQHDHVDVMPVFDAARPAAIPTGAFDFDGFTVVELPPTSVFGGDLEEPAPGVDLLAGELGFTALSAAAAATLLSGTGYSQLAGGQALRFDLQSFSLPGAIGSANLWYWDGVDDDGDGDYADDIDFAPATGVTLALERDGGIFSAVVDGANAAIAGFEIGVTALDDGGTADDETGFLHVDLDALLDDGDADPLTEVTAGIYVVGLTLAYPGAASDPLLFVYNGGLGEDAHDAALDYVPEPTGLALLLLGAALLRTRR